MWKVYENKDWNLWEAHYSTDENSFPIIVVKMTDEEEYKIMVKAKRTRMYVNNIFESNSDIAKLKGILRAKDLGWEIKSIIATGE